jgi:hypothetical protein
MQDKNPLYRHEELKEPTMNQGGPLSFVFFETPFASVSTVSRGHLSFLSLAVVVSPRT